MAIGTPVERHVVSLAAEVGTTVFSPTSTVAAGSRAILVANSAGNKFATAVVDSVGNVWTVHVGSGDGTRGHTVASCQVVTQITSGDTITITWSSAASTTAQLLVWEVTGLATSSSFDSFSANSETAGTTRTSNETADLAQPDELVVGLASQNAASTAVAGSGFTLATPLLATFTFAEWKIVSAKTRQAATFGTMNNGAASRVTVATFKSDFNPLLLYWTKRKARRGRRFTTLTK